jgi:hypothetical protein
MVYWSKCSKPWLVQQWYLPGGTEKTHRPPPVRIFLWWWTMWRQSCNPMWRLSLLPALGAYMTGDTTWITGEQNINDWPNPSTVPLAVQSRTAKTYSVLKVKHLPSSYQSLMTENLKTVDTNSALHEELLPSVVTLTAETEHCLAQHWQN